MTNSEKIKAYLDAGHKVKAILEVDKKKIVYVGGNPNQSFIVYGICDGGFFGIYEHSQENIPKFIADSWFDANICTITIHQEPLRYPNLCDKVVDRLGNIYIVKGNDRFACFVSRTTNYVNDCKNIYISYRDLAPYIE